MIVVDFTKKPPITKLPLTIQLASKLYTCQLNERDRRDQGLPPIAPCVELTGIRESGYIAKGLRGHVVCETEVGKFIVVLAEEQVLKYLIDNGVSYKFGYMGMPETQGEAPQ